MENKSISRSIKIKFLFVLFLSNASVFLLSSSTPKNPKNSQSSNPRADYILLKVNAENKTSLDSRVPVQMISKDNQTIFKNVFVLEKIEGDQGQILGTSVITSEYMIHIHAEDAKRINLSKSFLFYPTNLKITKSRKRRSYEVIF